MTKEKVGAVNKILLDGEPGNITKPDTNGYVGYAPQDIIDAMNEVFWGEWGFSELSNETVDNEKGTLAIAQVKVWLVGCDFQPTSWGQSRVTRGDIGDAKKGAQTDAMKKGLSLLSIGNRAYHGLLDGKAKSAQRPAMSALKSVPAPKQDEDTEPRLKQVRALFDTMFKNPDDRWDPFKVYHLGMPVSDDGLSLKELDKLYMALMDAKQQAKAS